MPLPCLVTAITCLKVRLYKEEGVGVPDEGTGWSNVANSDPPLRYPFRSLGVGEPRRAAHWKDKLMDRTDASKDHLDFKAALILAVLAPICLWPVVWELTSAIVQYLTPYAQ